MSFFKRSWKDLHRRLCELYEDIALESLTNNTNLNPVDFKHVMREVIKRIDPGMTDDEALRYIDSAYSSFKAFDSRDDVFQECRNRNSTITDAALEEIFAEIKNIYLEKMDEHHAFLVYVISRLLDPAVYDISRGAYLFEVVSGNAPEQGVLRRAAMLAKYKQIKEKKAGGE